MAKRILKGFGKYLVFLLLNGLGGIIVATIFTYVITNNFEWILGWPKEGTVYGNIIDIVSWCLWGLVGPILAVSVYPAIFKEFPPRWMGITSVSILIFSWSLSILAIVFGLVMGEDIELDTWKSFVSDIISIVTLWFLFSLPPLSRYDYDAQVRQVRQVALARQ